MATSRGAGGARTCIRPVTVGCIPVSVTIVVLMLCGVRCERVRTLIGPVEGIRVRPSVPIAVETALAILGGVPGGGRAGILIVPETITITVLPFEGIIREGVSIGAVRVVPVSIPVRIAPLRGVLREGVVVQPWG